MAANSKLNVKEVIEAVCSDDEMRDGIDICEEKVDKEREDRKKLSEWILRFECGEGFNDALFRSTAEAMLLPVLKLCQERQQDVRGPDISHILLSSNINADAVFKSESCLWLKGIHRRLVGRRNIRRPFYSEIRRDIPEQIFNVLVRAIKSSLLPELSEPNCCIAGNKKGKVISITSLSLLRTFLSWLSGKSVREVASCLERTLTGRRKDHKTKVLVSSEKDFGLIYNFAKGQLTVQFHYGGWNSYGFPQHSCPLTPL